jgi:hypothetical protein
VCAAGPECVSVGLSSVVDLLLFSSEIEHAGGDARTPLF